MIWGIHCAEHTWDGVYIIAEWNTWDGVYNMPEWNTWDGVYNIAD